MRAHEHLIIFLRLHMLASEHFKLSLAISILLLLVDLHKRTLVAQAYSFSEFFMFTNQGGMRVLEFLMLFI
jgi:hypothetical protein